MIQVKKMKRATLLGLVPVFALAALAGFAFISCDTGDAPDPATGPTSTYDPLFDDPQPGISARVNPSAISLPGTFEGGDEVAGLSGVYRDPAGNPVEGLQMNFKADPANPSISFRPPASFTDSNGQASTQVLVNVSTPQGSYALVAYTSPASGGANERGQTTLKVVTDYETLRITTSTLGGPYQSDTTASLPGPPVPGTGDNVAQSMSAVGGVPPYIWSGAGLPSNLTLAANGDIIGTISAPGTYAVSITVTDDVGGTASATYTLTAF
jgi:hypothetical protein